MAERWSNRIIGSGEEPPDQLLANPANFRIHPKAQQDALNGVLDEVGWVQQVIVNQQTGHLVDGHLRVSLALRQNEPIVPVLYVDLTPEEEALVLASLDPLAALAATDKAKLEALLHEVRSGDSRIQDMLSNLARKNKLIPPDASAQKPQPDEQPVTCPSCGHEFELEVTLVRGRRGR